MREYRTAMLGRQSPCDGDTGVSLHIELGITDMTLLRSIVLLLLGLASAQSSYSADCEELSTALKYPCLAKEYKVIDGLLVSKVKQLLESAQPADAGAFSPEVNADKRKKILAAIRSADRNWRQMAEAECGVLVDESFGMGNGGGIGALECRIQRTSERIRHLSKDYAYSWLW